MNNGLFIRSISFTLFAAIVLTGCGSPVEQGASGERVEVGSTEALVWGEGETGAVLVHGAAYDAASWEDLGRKMAEKGIVALAVEDAAPENLVAAVEYLEDERGARSVALVGGSAGGSAVLQAAEQSPGVADQLILLSASGEVSRLGDEPKLFVASEGEGLAGDVRRMAEEALGSENEALVLPGDAHAQAIFQTEHGERLTSAILERLDEYG